MATIGETQALEREAIAAKTQWYVEGASWAWMIHVGSGVVMEDLDALPQWLAARLRESDLAENIDKLRATGREELHLFLRIHDTAMPFSLYYPPAWDDCLPNTPLDAPHGLTGLWLVPAWQNPILWWGTRSGWHREDLY